MLFITACQDYKKVEGRTHIYQNTETELIREIMRKVSEKYDIEEDINITEIGYYDNLDGFSAFSFNDSKNIIYEGNAYAYIVNNEWKIFDMNISKLDKSVPFTTQSMALKNATHPERFYFISSGYILNKKISAIKITYSDHSVSTIEIDDDQHLYLDYKAGADIYRKDIVGLNKKGDIVHQYP